MSRDDLGACGLDEVAELGRNIYSRFTPWSAAQAPKPLTALLKWKEERKIICYTK
jgi:hypothetical protein